MPKSKKKKTNKPWQFFLKLSMPLQVVIIFVILFVLIQVVEQVKAIYVRHSLNNTESSITKITQAMPTEGSVKPYTIEKYCRRDAGKFTDGPLYCVVELKDYSTNVDGYRISNIARSEGFKQESFVNDNGNFSISGEMNSAKCRLAKDVGDMNPQLDIRCSMFVNKSVYPYRD